MYPTNICTNSSFKILQIKLPGTETFCPPPQKKHLLLSVPFHKFCSLPQKRWALWWLELPCILHHGDKVIIAVDGGTDSTVVIHKLIQSDLPWRGARFELLHHHTHTHCIYNHWPFYNYCTYRLHVCGLLYLNIYCSPLDWKRANEKLCGFWITILTRYSDMIVASLYVLLVRVHQAQCLLSYATVQLQYGELCLGKD